jgi:hypothetical protein
MRCEYCGSPVAETDADTGQCRNCGSTLPYVIRAAEKAEIVRRVLADGNSVRIEGDRIEATSGRDERAPSPASPRAMSASVVVALGAVVLAIGLAVFVRAALVSSSTHAIDVPPQSPELAQQSFEQPTVFSTAPAPSATADPPSPEAPMPSTPKGRTTATIVQSATTDSTIAAHKAQYNRCEADEVTRSPSAPRRYTLAITIDSQGHAEWVEVLSETSPDMRACVESVTRGLTFPRPADGSKRSIVTLSFAPPK